MWALRIIEINPVLEALPYLTASFKSVEINTFVLQGTPEALNHNIVYPTLPSMEMRMLEDLSTSIKSSLVNWLP